MLGLILLLMASPPKVKPPVIAATVAPAMVGGYAPVSRFAPELHTPFRTAVAAITPAKHPGAQLLAAERQVVAGTNYRLKLKLRDGSSWQAVVWHRLDGRFEVTETARLD